MYVRNAELGAEPFARTKAGGLGGFPFLSNRNADERVSRRQLHHAGKRRRVSSNSKNYKKCISSNEN